MCFPVVDNQVSLQSFVFYLTQHEVPKILNSISIRSVVKLHHWTIEAITDCKVDCCANSSFRLNLVGLIVVSPCMIEARKGIVRRLVEVDDIHLLLLELAQVEGELLPCLGEEFFILKYLVLEDLLCFTISEPGPNHVLTEKCVRNPNVKLVVYVPAALVEREHRV